MFLNEPPPTPLDLTFRIFGFPVRVHPLFWLVIVFLGKDSPGAAGLMAWVSAVFAAILVHELGHALAMRTCGFQPRITLHGLGGSTAYNPAGSWNRRGSATSSQVMICAAGPAAGFLLVAVLVAGLRWGGVPVAVRFLGWAGFDAGIGAVVGSIPLTLFLDYLLYVCLQWGLLNLLPVYPLDGGQIARELFMAGSRDGLRQSMLFSALVAATVCAMALLRMHDFWIALLFGYLAYGSFTAYQAYNRRGPW